MNSGYTPALPLLAEGVDVAGFALPARPARHDDRAGVIKNLPITGQQK